MESNQAVVSEFMPAPSFSPEKAAKPSQQFILEHSNHLAGKPLDLEQN